MNKSILIIGPIIVNHSSSGGEGEKLFQAFKLEGYQVLKTSGYRNKFLRMFDTIFYMLWNVRKYNQIVLMVFSGRAFVLESIVLFISKFLRKDVIGVVHGGAFLEFYKKNENWCNVFFRNCKSIATPSKMIQSFLTDMHFKVDYLPNFIDFNKFSSKNSVTESVNHRLLWVRAFHEIYNPELIIETMYCLKKMNRDYKLTMIGPDMGLLDKCEQLISKYDLANCIDIVGFVPNHELPNYYRSHNVFINTTRFESFGVCLVEAAACHLPIVSVSVGEIPLVWEHNRNIKLCKRNPEIFADEIIELIEDRKLSESISNEASILVKDFAWSNVKLKWNNILQR
jgi:glycosyltransferase involved in cell wall biosynthesis